MNEGDTCADCPSGRVVTARAPLRVPLPPTRPVGDWPAVRSHRSPPSAMARALPAWPSRETRPLTMPEKDPFLGSLMSKPHTSTAARAAHRATRAPSPHSPMNGPQPPDEPGSLGDVYRVVRLLMATGWVRPRDPPPFRRRCPEREHTLGNRGKPSRWSFPSVVTAERVPLGTTARVNTAAPTGRRVRPPTAAAFPPHCPPQHPCLRIAARWGPSPRSGVGGVDGWDWRSHALATGPARGSAGAGRSRRRRLGGAPRPRRPRRHRWPHMRLRSRPSHQGEGAGRGGHSRLGS